MRTILLIIEYDGTDYAGWQFQPDQRTIQAAIEGGLAKLLGHDVRVHSSGRTDAGVHARGMAAHFQADTKLPLKAFREGLNSHLPPDISVRQASDVPNDFHARFSARGKWYRYAIFRGPVRSPLAARTSLHLRDSLDLVAMRRAAAMMVGEHDFCAFRTTGCVAKTTVRELFSVEIVEHDDFLYLDVRGSGFLRHMIRIMVGTLIEVGQGRRSPEEIELLLTGASALKSGPTAPALGLCLMQVWYDDEAVNAPLT